MIKNKTFKSFDGSKIHYSLIGTGKKKVFLLHGLLQDRLPWVPFCLPLMRKYTFVLLESRGMGFSENKSILSTNVHLDIARDLSILAKKLLVGDEKAILGAVSMGNVPIWYLKENFGSEWVEKYICIDHSLAIQISGVEESIVFTKKSNEFWSHGKFITNYIRENPVYSQSITLLQAPKHIKKRAFAAHKNVVVDSAINAKTYRFFVDLVPDLSNYITMIFTRYNKTWAGQYVAGASYFEENQNDFRDLVKSIDKPMIFFCGKINRAFDYDWQMKLLKENKPEAKVYTFEKSGHDLMFAEPIKFFKCFKEALED